MTTREHTLAAALKTLRRRTDQPARAAANGAP